MCVQRSTRAQSNADADRHRGKSDARSTQSTARSTNVKNGRSASNAQPHDKPKVVPKPMPTPASASLES